MVPSECPLNEKREWDICKQASVPAIQFQITLKYVSIFFVTFKVGCGYNKLSLATLNIFFGPLFLKK
jgi:hypothetical protein